MEEKNGKVQIIFKNISKYALDISSEELIECFVRGDELRNTEGICLRLFLLKGDYWKELKNGGKGMNENYRYGVSLDRVGDNRAQTIEVIRRLKKCDLELVRELLENTPTLIFVDVTMETAEAIQKAMHQLGNTASIKKMDEVYREMMTRPEIREKVNKKVVKKSVGKLILALILSIIPACFLAGAASGSVEMEHFVKLFFLLVYLAYLYASSIGALIRISIEKKNKDFAYVVKDSRRDKLKKEIQKYQGKKLKYKTMEENIRHCARVDYWHIIGMVLVAGIVLGVGSQLIWQEAEILKVVIGIAFVTGIYLLVSHARVSKDKLELVIEAARQRGISYLDVKHDFMQGTMYKIQNGIFHISPKYSIYIEYINRDSWLIENNDIDRVEKFALEETKINPNFHTNGYVLKFYLKSGKEFIVAMDNLKASVILDYYQQQEIDTIDRFPYVWKRIKN